MRSQTVFGTHQYAPKAMDESGHEEHTSRQPLSPLKCEHCPFHSISISHMKQHASNHLEVLAIENSRSSNQTQGAVGDILLEEDDDWSAVEVEFTKNPFIYSKLFKFNCDDMDKVHDKDITIEDRDELDGNRGNLDETNGDSSEVLDNLAVDNSPPDNDWGLMEAEYPAQAPVSAVSYQGHSETAVISNPKELFYSEEDNDWADLENQFAKAVTSMVDYIDLANDVETIKVEDDCVDINWAEDEVAVRSNSYHLFDLDCLSVAHYKDERDCMQTGVGNEGRAWLSPDCGNNRFERRLGGSIVNSTEKTPLKQGDAFPCFLDNNNNLQPRNVQDLCNTNRNHSSSEISSAHVNSVEEECREANNHVLGLPSECCETAPGMDSFDSCVVEVASKAQTVITSESRVSTNQANDLTTVNSKHQIPVKETSRLHSTSISLLKCRYCSFKAITREGLELHQSKHSRQNRRTQFLCHLCPFKSFYKHHVKRHVCHRHPTSAAAKELSTPRDKNIKYALTDKRVYYCPICPEFRSVWRRCFMRHLERHAAVGVLCCNKCTYETDSPTCFNRHLRGHDIRQTFSCSECSYKTTYKKILKKHTLRYHQEFSVKKEKVDDIGRVKGGLPISYTSKLRSATRQLLPIFKTELFPADEIEQQTAVNEGFPFSKAGFLSISKAELAPSEEEEVFSSVGHVTTSSSTLQVSSLPFMEHNSKCHKALPENSSAPPVQPRVEKLLQVPNQKIEATTPTSPDIKSSHISNTRSVNLLKCPHCDFTSFWKKNLYRHLSFHSSASVLQCDKCTFSTYTEGAMHQHRSTHVEEVLQCHLCNFRSTFKSGLKRHVTRKHFWSLKSVPATATGTTAPLSTPGLLISLAPTLPSTNKSIAVAETSPVRKIPYASLKQGVAGEAAKGVAALGSTAEPRTLQQKSADCKNLAYTAGPYTWCRAASAPPLAVSTNPKHLGKPLYQCCFCSYSSVCGQLYRFHMARHTGQGLLHCPYCDYSCGSTGNFKKHLGVHVRRGHIRSVGEVTLDGCFGARGADDGGWGAAGGVTGLDEGRGRNADGVGGNDRGMDESGNALGGWVARGNVSSLDEGHGWGTSGAGGNVRCLNEARARGADGGWGTEGNVNGLDEGHGEGADSITRNVTGLDGGYNREAGGGGGGMCASGSSGLSESRNCGNGKVNNSCLGGDSKESNSAVGGSGYSRNKFEAAIASGNFFFSSAAFTNRVTNIGKPGGIEMRDKRSVATAIPSPKSCTDQSKLKNSVAACADRLPADDRFVMEKAKKKVIGEKDESSTCARKAKIREAIEAAVRAPAKVRKGICSDQCV